MYGDANAVSNPVQRRKTSDSGDRRGNSPSNKLKQGILLFRGNRFIHVILFPFIYMHTKKLLHMHIFKKKYF